MDSLNNLQISCKKCNVTFKLGDHVVMTKNTDFYHLLCFKRLVEILMFKSHFNSFNFTAKAQFFVSSIKPSTL